MDASATPATIVKAGTGPGRRLLAVFGATLFLSALLLFAIQPLFAKMVLPRFGGTPAVWSIGLAFFQAVLLAGYAYAHLIVRLAGRFGLAIHAVVMATALLWLPVGVVAGFAGAGDANLPLAVLSVFFVSVGVPFFAVSANAPLLQVWFAKTGAPGARDPYFLYGASNIGSFAALLLYPTLIEPLLPLAAQSYAWSAAYAALVIAVISCGLLAAAPRGATQGEGTTVALPSTAGAAPVSARLQWIGYAFLPSALLVAVTAHLSTNIAAAPFLWTMPLAVFLLSFVVVFTANPLLPRRATQLMLTIVVPAAMATATFSDALGGFPGIAINILAVFVIAAAWHGELFARRPQPAHLTEFYLFMSLGGVLGGIFASLVAPVIFESVIEFPLLLVGSLLVVPEARHLLFRRRRISYAVLGAGILSYVVVGLLPGEELRERNFFGVLSTRTSGEYRVLMHGTTVHGAENLADLDLPAPARPAPLTYYAADGPLAQGIQLARASKQSGSLSIGVVGLGAGSLACYSELSDRWRFFEIDPDVIRIARDARNFSFLSRCAPDAPILAGDARLTLEHEADGAFDVLVIDAFSSDAIPVHLLTREAFSLYARKITPGGIVLLHLSNRFLELLSVVDATARVEGLSAAFMIHKRSDADFRQRLLSSSAVGVLAQDPAALDRFVEAAWTPFAPGNRVAAWSDDYSNIVGAMLRKQGFGPLPRLISNPID